MSNLNLIPERERKVIKRELRVILFTNFAVWLFLTALVVGMVLSWGKFFLERKLAEVQERSILISETRLVLGDEIRVINSKVKELDEIQRGHVRWSAMLTELAALVPAGVSLNAILINAPEENIVLRGFSRDRTDLLKFEENLRGFQYLSGLESPLSNLLSPIEIDFEFSATLVLDS